MKKYGLIGYPIAHSMSPSLFKEYCKGQYSYDLIEEEDFDTAWKRFTEGGYSGINVTAPFKEKAFNKSDIQDEGSKLCKASNIIVKEDGLYHAYNSDFLAVKKILEEISPKSVCVIGNGGAGRAAFQAAEVLGLKPSMVHHEQLADTSINTDMVIFTLPQSAKGYERIKCNYLLEANYKNPRCKNLPWVKNYIGGEKWLTEQALTGYPLLTSGK